jgi:hypothetical protein
MNNLVIYSKNNDEGSRPLAWTAPKISTFKFIRDKMNLEIDHFRLLTRFDISLGYLYTLYSFGYKEFATNGIK